MGSLCVDIDNLAELLIPGLPNHLALLCLTRAPRIRHGFLRLVNSAWRAALSSPEFFRLRACLGCAEESILIVSEQHMPMAAAAVAAKSVQCVELSLGSASASHVMASWTHEEARRMFLRGQVCAQAGPAVLFAGGYTQDLEAGWVPTGHTWRLCVLTWRVRAAACMRTPRASFAWAVFGSRLVVAGGESMPGERTAEVEAYDFGLDAWVPLKPIPKAMKIHSYFTCDGRLFVRGWDLTPGHISSDNPADNFSSEVVFSYHPASDTWSQEEKLQWMGSLQWNPCCVTVATGPPGDAVVCASLCSEANFFGDEFLATSLRIRRISPMPPIGGGGGNNSTSGSSSGKVKPEWEIIDVLDRVCTPSVFTMHGCSGKAVLVLPYDLAGLGHRHSACLLAKEQGQEGPDIVLKKCSPDLIEVCVRCCYCIRCCLTSALITL